MDNRHFSRIAPLYDSSGEVIKSSQAQKPAHIIYVNKSGRTVQICWVDYEGSFVKYATLDHGKLFRAKTFVGHPWVAFSEVDSKRMHFYYKPTTNSSAGAAAAGMTSIINNKEISNSSSFSTSFEYQPKFSSILWPASTHKRASVAFILSPVYTLKEVCFRHLQILGLSYESASQLQLPRRVFEDLVDFAKLVPMPAKCVSPSEDNESNPNGQSSSSNLPFSS